jgi:multidrug efflux pump subunit AcrB/outer membrane protein TolC
MIRYIIRYFCFNPVVVNILTLAVFIGGFLTLQTINRDELPDITFNTIRISTSYYGAAAEDVESRVTDPLEKAIRGLDGVAWLTSNSSQGHSMIYVDLESSVSDMDAALNTIRNAIARVDLPDDVTVPPTVTLFETSKKAIIDIAIFNANTHVLTADQRRDLQAKTRLLMDQLTQLPAIYAVSSTGYLEEQLTIEVNPNALSTYSMDLSTIANEIRTNHVDYPAGTLDSPRQESITLSHLLDTPNALSQLVVQGGFDSPPIRLSQLATVEQTLSPQTVMTLVDGHEAIVLRVVKHASVGILEALQSVHDTLNRFRSTYLIDSPIALVPMDDESVDLRNRLGIVASNGIMGFGLIAVLLMVFLNARSGFWVALGIPFSLAFTIIVAYFIGYSINVVTLSAIIIVLGIVVDDAIIVAENIQRHHQSGKPFTDAVVDGTAEVFPPILASILTTCIAFLPLLYFDGRFGKIVYYLPIIIFLMLGASLLESFTLLPAHLAMGKNPPPTNNRFDRMEALYTRVLVRLLPFSKTVIGVFVLGLLGTLYMAKSHFHFVLFPNTESREIVLSGTIENVSTIAETALALQPLDVFLSALPSDTRLATQTTLGQGRGGMASDPGTYQMVMELHPKDQRSVSLDDCIATINAFAASNPVYNNLRIRKNRWGQSSGSVYHIAVRHNDNTERKAIVDALVAALSDHPELTHVEPDVVRTEPAYTLLYDSHQLKQLSVSPTRISTALRTILSGTPLFTLSQNDRDLDVLLSVPPAYTTDLARMLTIPVANQYGYMVPLGQVATAQKTSVTQTIRRDSLKRVSYVYADPSPTATMPPIAVAKAIESTVFAPLLAQYPHAQIVFEGEVMDTVESRSRLITTLVTVVGLIYIVLAILFNSFIRPVRVLLLIPFGIMGVILAFYAHQKWAIGFYACIGTIGMIGVVINDAIVMLNRLDAHGPYTDNSSIASVAASRLRAVCLTTLTTVAGLLPTAYGVLGEDPMLTDMMLALAWGLVWGAGITLLFVPCMVAIEASITQWFRRVRGTRFLLGGIMVVGTLFWPHSAWAAPLYLPDYIAQALQKNSRFKAYAYEVQQSYYSTFATVPFWDVVGALSIQSSVLGPSDPASQRLSLQHLHPEWGQSIAIFHDIGDQTTQLTVSQDIGQNALGRRQKLDARLSDIAAQIALFEINEAYENTVSDLIIMYYDWLRQYKSMLFSEQALTDNLASLDAIKRRQKTHIADDTDVAKLQLQIIAKEETFLQLSNDYAETSRRIKQAIGDRSDRVLTPETTLVLRDIPDTVTDVLDQYTASRSYALFRLIETRVKLNQDRVILDTLPSVSFVSQVDYSDTTDWRGTAGIRYQQSVINRSALAQKARADLAALQTSYTVSGTESTRKTAIVNQFYRLQYLKKRIQLAQKKMDAAQLIYTNERDNYTLGKTNLNDYLSAINSRDSAHFAYLNQMITYQQDVIELKRLTDQVVDTLPLLETMSSPPSTLPPLTTP